MRRTLSITCCALALAATGCTVGPQYHRPSAPVPPAWSQSSAPPPAGTWQHAKPSDAALRGDWWKLYGDRELNALEARVSVSNQTLQAAVDQYLAAREQVQEARSQYFPTLTAGPSISRTRSSNNAPNSHAALSQLQYNTYVLQGQASWQPDFFGRVRRSVEAARANAQASAAEAANVELSLQAELALDYFEMRGLDLQQQILNRTLKTYQDYLSLTEIRFHGGVATESDVALAQTQLESTKTQAIDIGVARSQYEHAIATLLGVPASQFHLPPAPLSPGLPQIPAGVPSQLLERRPDIAAAERSADAANAQIGIAISAYYPDITLTGSGGFEGAEPGTWIQGPSELWSLGASAMELLFDGGQRHALTRQARDEYAASVANYRQTVLQAFQEVEDNLSALRILQQESVTQANAVAAARHSLQVSTHRYEGGVTTYLEVLTAQSAQLSNERTQADITTRQFAASVQLIEALGGGWSTAQLPKM
ncbi:MULTISPECIES: efflux transporter outer membrane subunit [Acidobacterium]|uniref:RND efflux system, outer membrane lipoprotein, NodT family n=1 Tax=Acidobacterium capsulatum (strain ATCC 51196 / DSM 11244 / BCRC 80197 / JCM 7670 / NBRC 15755 / NCIMB 13165 / 161) TaxID=240015 RepID=C1FA92_ACIC5|nr:MULTISPECIES: efflux transporter outer membrane subunit [Acidobacterium]ACO34059.1 RND efflux system, outer membrane lipoprotein, NodT family [Acidobacterium capsulatum ATCC 51196]HCT62326.1 RND transporter [Acidobacterium sp.]